MNEKKLTQNFKSYINVSPEKKGDKNGSIQEVKPKLLNGELIVGEAHSVVMLTPLTERDSGRFGSLFVTNYKLSFVPLDTSTTDEYGQRNHLVGPYDVPLTGVGALWQTDGGANRRRRILPRADVSVKLKGLQVVCKNMKVLTFNFANSSIGSGRKVAMALLHHAFPKRHDLLFAFEYKEPYYPTLPSDMNMFQRPGDWKRELERCECPHWRITCINGTSDAFMLTAGETIIVPSSVLDYNLMESARHFRSGRVPVWVWGRAEGAALLRSGELLPTEQSATAESVLLEQVRRSHPKLTPPYVIYLCGNSFTNTGGSSTLPSLSTLNASFKKLTELFTPTTLSNFWLQDAQYYSILDSSRWLRYVANCLAFADDAARHLADNVTVVLQEGDGVDYSAVVSSLAQLLLDPRARQLPGFQSLVQKEWLALGHPFADRLGLPRPGKQKEDALPVEAPVFLLFLDCTYQLLRQFPAAFQFSDIYLTTLWDATHNHLFDTFLFNCPRDRDLAVSSNNFVQRPVWDWEEQFSEQDISLFYNPLYVDIKTVVPTPASRLCVVAVLRAMVGAAGRAARRARAVPRVELRPAGTDSEAKRETIIVIHNEQSAVQRVGGVRGAGGSGRGEPLLPVQLPRGLGRPRPGRHAAQPHRRHAAARLAVAAQRARLNGMLLEPFKYITRANPKGDRSDPASYGIYMI